MENSLKRYIKAYIHFLKNSFAVDSEYRVSFLLKNLASLSWVFGSLFFIDVIFSKASQVGGWSRLDVTLLYVSFAISMDFFDLFLRGNFIKFSALIGKGELDKLLVRPINLRFMASLMGDGIESSIILRFILSVGLVFYFLPPEANLMRVVSYFLFLGLGNFAVYSVIFMFHTLNIWLVKVDNMTVFSQTTFGLTRMPLESWPKLMQVFLIYIFPMGLTSNFAVLALLGKTNITHILTALVVSGGLFLVSQKFWNFALRRYSSASS